MRPDESMTPTTDVSSWKKKSRGMEPVEVPSGNKAIIRRKPMETFLKAGLIPNDLMPIVKKAMQQGKADLDAGQIMEDPRKITAVFDLIDMIVVECVVEPKVYKAPLREEDRDEDTLYVDEVDWDDRQFIYQYALGSVADLEEFRQRQTPDVEPVQPREDVEDKTVVAVSD